MEFLSQLFFSNIKGDMLYINGIILLLDQPFSDMHERFLEKKNFHFFWQIKL